MRRRNHVDDLQGAGRLAIEATQGLTQVVEAMHSNIASGPTIFGMRSKVYGRIRGTTRLVGAGIELVLAQIGRLIGDRATRSPPQRDAALAVVNGVLGDYLSETDNPLAIPMQLRQRGAPLVVESQVGGKLLVLVHGSCRTDVQWSRLGHDHGAELARDLGYTPVYLLYNSGLHVSTNGRAFAALLEQLVAHWPVPLHEVVLLAHSMGGLVSRSACHVAEVEGHFWRNKLRRLICLGTPHHGAPLERGGNWVDLLLSISRYSAPLAQLGQIRSAGVTDMRFGNVLDEHWEGRNRFALARDPRVRLKLPQGVACYAIAATKTPRGGAHLASDGLVPVDSALGRHERPELTLRFPEAHQWVGHQMSHLDLLSRAEVYQTVQQWLTS